MYLKWAVTSETSNVVVPLSGKSMCLVGSSCSVDSKDLESTEWSVLTSEMFWHKSSNPLSWKEKDEYWLLFKLTNL